MSTQQSGIFAPDPAEQTDTGQQSSTPAAVTPEQQEGLEVARQLIQAGVPVFAAPPCPAASGQECDREGHRGKEEYHLPPKWQLTVPSEVWLQRWQPGWALGAVGGGAADFLDEDPRNGGEASIAELSGQGHMPRVYGVAETPSGGRHYVVAPMGERKGELLPGVDYQGGQQDGVGRGFVWIAPTVKRSKNIADAGMRRPYRWVHPPDTEWLSEGGDESGEHVVARLRAARERKPAAPDDRAVREFTEEQARAFCDITLKPLMQAQIGQIEERANSAAVQLSHFVPDFWPELLAYAVLEAALQHTAYDPEGPSAWTAEKFHAVLSGERQRAPQDWKAVRVPASGEEAVAAVAVDEVDALLSEFLTAEEVMARPPKKSLIRGLVHLDTVVWVIGAPGSKKSFVVLSMAGDIANGRPWQGMPTTQGPVVVIAAEGAGGLGNRLKAYEKEHGPIGSNVRVLPRPVQSADLKAWAVLVKACERLKPVLVVIDTQARVTVGLEENSAKEMGIFVDAADAIRRATGACVMPVHHTGRNGGDARGSSAIDGAQDTELKVMVGAGELRGELRVEKQKDLEMLAPIPLLFRRIDLGLNEDGEPQSSLVLTGPDSWSAAQNAGEDAVEPSRSVRVREPGPWTYRLVTEEGAQHVVVRQVLQAVLDIAGREGPGISKAEARRVVTECWYQEHGATARSKRGVDEQTWNRSWSRAAALLDPASGVPILTAGDSKERKIIHPDVDVTGE